MIQLENIHVDFKVSDQRIHAVNDVSLRIKEGEVFGIVGASGAGKSTLLRVINLLETPSAGHVVLNGKDITHFKGKALRQERHKIGMIFQHFNLMHTRTVYENAAYALHVAGISHDEIAQRVPEILNLVGLTDKAQAYPSQLSGGQKQRVGIARAVANHPRVLLCDEPTSALDLETSAAILELLREINQRLGITIVLISHEMEVIKKICSRVAVMEAGKVIEHGSAFDIFAKPQHSFTQQLVAHTLNLEIPQHLRHASNGEIWKLVFHGAHAENGVLSEASRKFDIAITLLHGKIEYIGDLAIGVFVIQLSDAIEEQTLDGQQGIAYRTRLVQAREFLSAHADHIQELS